MDIDINENDAGLRKVPVFLVDQAGDGYTGSLAFFTITFSKPGAGDVDRTAFLTAIGGGRYTLDLPAGDVDTAGAGWIVITKPGTIRPFVDPVMIRPSVRAAITAGTGTVTAAITAAIATIDAHTDTETAVVIAALATVTTAITAAVTAVNAHTDTDAGTVTTALGALSTALAAAIVTIDAHTDTETAFIVATLSSVLDSKTATVLDAIDTIDVTVGDVTIDASSVADAIGGRVLDPDVTSGEGQTYDEAINLIADYCAGDGDGMDGLVGSIKRRRPSSATEKTAIAFTISAGTRRITKRDGTP